MSKVKRTPVPLPGSISKSQISNARTTPKVSFKSQEFIERSDDSSNESPAAAKSAAKTKQKKSPVKIAVYKPNGSTKKSQVSSLRQKSAPKDIVMKELDETSSSEDNDETTKSQTDLLQKKGVDKTAAQDSESESDSTRSSTSSSDDSDSESVPAKPRNAEIGRTESQAPHESHTVEFRPALPYVPPKGFSAVPKPLKTTSEAAQIFQDLEGKQVWHITAPAGVSMSDLERITMSKVLEGQPVLNHKGSDYGLISRDDHQEGSRAVLIPQQNGYKSVLMPISQTFHLQQVLRLPKLSSLQTDPSKGSEAAASITRSTIRAPRPQVRGLKMRFHLSAFGDEAPGTIGQSDGEEEVPKSTAGLGIPNGSQTSKKPEKRKHTELNGDDVPTKKAKKHKSTDETLSKEERKAKKEKRRRDKEQRKAGS
ncbi:DNA-directed RNA polymerase I subunit RPA34.5-domain-containing protein [Dendryphion nanum]|uniref:DNA-directed RNA polymerase I subunit RPA34.5-domain-containing protein n=1 Tax=Dendryphion nanum TaxID=256645 RepID=A0A9P9EI26_9PLEO|nr:DNA-directed RNA polymerase I subunit RPA34.5-domain-containing protein [Dendryphion nanum]